MLQNINFENIIPNKGWRNRSFFGMGIIVNFSGLILFIITYFFNNTSMSSTHMQNLRSHADIVRNWDKIVFLYHRKPCHLFPFSDESIIHNMIVKYRYTHFQNIIAGAVYDLWGGFIMCCFLTTGKTQSLNSSTKYCEVSAGSTLCYLFSELFGREYVFYYFGQKLTYLQQKVCVICVCSCRRLQENEQLRIVSGRWQF